MARLGVCPWSRLPPPGTLTRAPSIGARQRTRISLESIPMTRPAGHPAVRPFRLTQSAVEAHREHFPTPFLGCPVCARRTATKGIDIRWMSPRRI